MVYDIYAFLCKGYQLEWINIMYGLNRIFNISSLLCMHLYDAWKWNYLGKTNNVTRNKINIMLLWNTLKDFHKFAALKLYLGLTLMKIELSYLWNFSN